MALTKDDKEFIRLSLEPITKKLDTFEQINKKQDERLEKLEDDKNQKDKVVITMDNWMETRGLTCPQNERIKEVEQVQNNNKVTKKFVFKLIAWVTGGATFALTALKLV